MSIKTNMQSLQLSQPDDQVKDLIDLLNLAIKRTSDKLKQLDDSNLNANDRKELLGDVQKQIHKAN